MAITIDEVKAIGERWCDTLRQGGSSAAERETFFLHHPARLYVHNKGISMSLEDHHAYHQQFSHQHLELGDFDLMQVSDEPERVRAIGSLYWEAHYPEAEKREPLRCVVFEDWTFERIPSGEIKWVLWLIPNMHFLPASSVGRLTIHTADG